VPPSRLRVSSPGGGGYGDPLDRDPENVLRDVRDEVIGARSADEVYGVVLAAGGRSFDAVATEARRAELRRGRLREATREPPAAGRVATQGIAR
jgi:N-methylhydantoinase B